MQVCQERLEKLYEAENLSTAHVLEQQDVKISVAMNEIQKWTDNSYLIAQSIIEESERKVTWEQILTKFPYLGRL